MPVVIRPHRFDLGKGVIMVLKLFIEVLKKIVEGVIIRAIYDWFKSIFEDND